jgi:MoxR-like ATPase
MIIAGKSYALGSIWGPVSISDDFVVPANKIGVGSGATRLYIGRQDDDGLRKHFGQPVFSASCVMLKADLLTFFNDMKDEYDHPTQPYKKSNELPNLWLTRLDQISSLPDVITFDIQEQVATKNRCYIKGDGHFDLLRELPLRRKAEVTFTELVGEDGQILQMVRLLPKLSIESIRYWQVQHGATGQEAESLGLLWSPKKKPKDGSSSKWYDNMAEVRENDRVYSYRGGKIQAVGVVRAEAISAPSPFSDSTNSDDGWLVAVDFMLIPTPFSPTDNYELLRNCMKEIDKTSVRPPGGTAIIGYLKEISVDLAYAYDELGGLLDDDSLGMTTTKESLELMEKLERLAEDLLLPSEFLVEIADLLDDKKQVIFYGPPGAGKTYVAIKLAEALSEGSEELNPVEVVQFHPSYAYEDYVEGFRPTEEGKFKLHSGKLLSIANRADKNPDVKFFLIIDEINRGNVAKIFGEMYFLLEYRSRAIQLQYSDKEFRMPENLYFIGTMNSADRSIGLIDTALRRRFHFVSFYPTEDALKDVLRNWLVKNAPKVKWVADLVDHVNQMLGNRDFAIGPSHFMKPNLNEDRIRKIWRRSIIPYIEDIFFNRKDEVIKYELDNVRIDLDRVRTLKRLDVAQPTEEIGEDGDAASA